MDTSVGNAKRVVESEVSSSLKLAKTMHQSGEGRPIPKKSERQVTTTSEEGGDTSVQWCSTQVHRYLQVETIFKTNTKGNNLHTNQIENR